MVIRTYINWRPSPKTPQEEEGRVAIALEEGFAVLTENLEHFGRIRDLQVITTEEALSRVK